MTRAAITMLALATWLTGALAGRAWFGGKAYFSQLFGNEQRGAEAFATLLARPETQLAGMDPWTLLLASCVAASAALVLVILMPWDLLLRRVGLARHWRALTAAGLGSLAAGTVLLSIHPLLSRPSVPEGPRTILNFACEAAGYDWVNAIVHLGAIAAGIVIALWPAASNVEPDEAEPPAAIANDAPDSAPDAAASDESSVDADEPASDSDPSDEPPSATPA